MLSSNGRRGGAERGPLPSGGGIRLVLGLLILTIITSQCLFSLTLISIVHVLNLPGSCNLSAIDSLLIVCVVRSYLACLPLVYAYHLQSAHRVCCQFTEFRAHPPHPLPTYMLLSRLLVKPCQLLPLHSLPCFTYSVLGDIDELKHWTISHSRAMIRSRATIGSATRVGLGYQRDTLEAQ